MAASLNSNLQEVSFFAKVFKNIIMNLNSKTRRKTFENKINTS